ncbi:ankyrin repeat-containing domain protein [Mycena sanguinolenta]|nr:ankyrin repeat-containing domain protein [Mycena sanguinolenta]
MEDTAHQQEVKLAEAERSTIIEWLSPINPFQRQRDIFSTLEPGTGEWLLEDPKFKAWEAGSKPLWCHGIAGAGKTMLTSLVVHHEESRRENIGLAWIYLNYKETDSQTSSNIFGSFLKQLALTLKLIPAGLRELYHHHHARQIRPTAEELIHEFPAMIAAYSQVYLILDGFDECPKDRRHIISKMLVTIIGGSVCLMVTSRSHLRPDSYFPDIEILEIRPADDDIARFVDQQISESPPLSKYIRVQPQLAGEIRTAVVKNAQGMFLLPKLHILSLAAKLTIKAVREALQHLPKDLDRMYDETMERIDDQREEERELACRVFLWVSNSKRNLTVAELLEALAIEPGSTTLSLDNLLDIDTILSVCGGLVMVDESTSVVRLIHYTTQSYIAEQIQPKRFPGAHTEITLGSLTYLSFTDFVCLPESVQDVTRLLDEHPFLSYCQHCLAHAVGEPELALQGLLIAFVTQIPKWREFWIRTLHGQCIDVWSCQPGYWPEYAMAVRICVSSNLRATAKRLLGQTLFATENQFKSRLLYLASSYGDITLAEICVESEVNLDAWSGDIGTALCVAALEGHLDIVQLLLDKGANPDAGDASGYGTALQAAASVGNLPVMQHLVGAGANLNGRGELFGTPLQEAAHAGHYGAVRFLIEKGADLNLTGGEYGTALHAATAKEHISVVQILLDGGADPNVDDGEAGTALHIAASTGSSSILKLLVDNGADVNQDAGYGGTPFHEASYAGNDWTVQFLIERGAQVPIHGGRYGTALHAAVAGGHLTIVKLLVKNGADVNADDGELGTALQVASSTGNLSIMRLLISRGAKMNPEAGFRGTALHDAVYSGQATAVQYLIHKGVDVNARGGLYGPALHVAAAQGHLTVVKLLIEHGADVNAEDGEHGTALQIASSAGNLPMMKFIIENGANVNLKAGFHKTALHNAAYSGQIGAVMVLIKNGMHVNARGGLFGTALHAAAAGGHVSVVEVLIANGAHFIAEVRPLGTPLEAARRYKQMGVVRTLESTSMRL